MQRYKCNGRYFDSLAEASEYARRYFRRYGVILRIETAKSPREKSWGAD